MRTAKSPSADYAAVPEHYVKGFAAQGYVQNVLSATPAEDKHDCLKGGERVAFKLVQMPKGEVKANIVAVLPAPTFGKTPR